MAKKNFTNEDNNKYSGIIGGMDENTKTTKTTKKTNATKETKETKSTKGNNDTEGKKPIGRVKTGARMGRPPKAIFNPDPAQEEYRFTVRMPGICGQFIAELAYQKRSTITAEFQRLVEQEMEKHPEILESLDELNKLGKGNK